MPGNYYLRNQWSTNQPPISLSLSGGVGWWYLSLSLSLSLSLVKSRVVGRWSLSCCLGSMALGLWSIYPSGGMFLSLSLSFSGWGHTEAPQHNHTQPHVIHPRLGGLAKYKTATPQYGRRAEALQSAFQPVRYSVPSSPCFLSDPTAFAPSLLF